MIIYLADTGLIFKWYKKAGYYQNLKSRRQGQRMVRKSKEQEIEVNRQFWLSF